MEDEDTDHFNEVLKGATIYPGPDCTTPWVRALSAIILGADQSLKTYHPPLTLASATKNTLLVQALLKLGAAIDARDCDHRTALCHSVANDDLATAEVLLTAGADPNLAACDDIMPLHVAARCSPAMVSLLLEHRADPTARDAAGKSPLDHARNANNRAAAVMIEEAVCKARAR